MERLGIVELTQEARLNASGDGGGTVILRSGRLLVDSSTVSTDTLGDRDGAEIGIDIDVAEDFVVTNGGIITTNALGAGNAGDIRIRASDTEMSNSSFVNSQVAPDAVGDSGNITVEVDSLRLKDGAQIFTNTLGAGQGGTVRVTATGAVTLSGTSSDGAFPSVIATATQGPVAETGTTGTLTGTRSNGIFPSGITTATPGMGIEPGAAGAVVIEATEMIITGGAQIFSTTAGAGQGGTVTVTANDAVTLKGMSPNGAFPSGIFANAIGSGEEAGDAGTVMVEAATMRATEGALISSLTIGSGKAGDVVVTVETLTLTEGAQINSLTTGTGSGGNVRVTAADTVTLIGTAPDPAFPSGIFAQTHGQEMEAGAAGAIMVKAKDVVVIGGAQINSDTFGTGQGGTITVTVTDTLTLTGRIPGTRIASGIFAETHRQEMEAGAAGAIVIKAKDVVVTGGAQINSGSFGEGQGGSVTVTATDTVRLEGPAPGDPFPSAIFANAEGLGKQAGDAGAVVVEAKNIILTEGAQIGSATLGAGQGGVVTVTATDTIILVGRESGLVTRAEGSGAGGDIILRAGVLELTDKARISAENVGTDAAGGIRITATELSLSEDSTVTTESAQAGGGNIEIEAQTVSMVDSDITATVRSGEGSSGNILIGGTINAHGDIIEGTERLALEGSHITANTDAGDGANIAIGARQVVLGSDSEIAANTNAGVGGNVTIAGTVAADGQALTRAGTIVLRDSQITANADQGRGGRIDIVAEAFLADPASVVDASSQEGGIDGEVNVEAVVTNLSEIVTPLSSQFAQDVTLLHNQCASRLREGSVSSFVERGREDVATSPDGILPRRLDRMTLDHVDKTNAAGLPTLSQPSGRRWASLERDALGVRPMQVGSVNLPVTNCDRP